MGDPRFLWMLVVPGVLHSEHDACRAGRDRLERHARRRLAGRGAGDHHRGLPEARPRDLRRLRRDRPHARAARADARAAVCAARPGQESEDAPARATPRRGCGSPRPRSSGSTSSPTTRPSTSCSGCATATARALERLRGAHGGRRGRARPDRRRASPARLLAEMIEAERDVLQGDARRACVPGRDAQGDRARAGPRRVAPACADSALTRWGVLAAILESDDPERLYTGLSLLVSAASDGRGGARRCSTSARCVRCWTPSSSRARDARHVIDAERERVRPHAGRAARHGAGAPDCRIWACAAAAQATGADWRRAGRLEGVISTPQFLREVAGAQLSSYEARAARCSRVLLAGCGGPAARPVRGQALRRRPQRQPHAARLRRRHVTCNGAQARAAARDAAARPRAHARPLRAGRAQPRAAAGPNSVLSYRCGWRPARSPSPTPRARCRRRSPADVFTKDVTEDVCGSRLATTWISSRDHVRRSPVAAARQPELATRATSTASPRCCSRSTTAGRRRATRCSPPGAEVGPLEAAALGDVDAPRGRRPDRPRRRWLHAAAPRGVLRRRRSGQARSWRRGADPTPTPTTRSASARSTRRRPSATTQSVRALLEAGANPNVAPAGRLHAAATPRTGTTHGRATLPRAAACATATAPFSP